MKSYNHLYDACLSDENIILAIENGLKTRKRKDSEKLKKNPKKSVERIRKYAKKFKPVKHNKVKIIDGPNGKQREIIVPNTKEHIIHHMVVQQMMPIFTEGMYAHTYASIPGRGLHGCVKQIKRWMKNDPAGTKYALKLDIRKFFDNIDHDTLKEMIKKKVADKDFLKMVYAIIDSTPHGIPLGFYTSHWFANWYLQPLDHYIKEKLHIKYYARFMDDMVLFDSNKKKLGIARRKISKWLKEHGGLSLKDDWQVFPICYKFSSDENLNKRGRPLQFIGFKFYRDTVILRKKLFIRIMRKVRKIKKKRRLDIHDARSMISYFGWMEWADLHKVFKKYIKPYITKKMCIKRIRQYEMKVKARKHRREEIERLEKKIKKYETKTGPRADQKVAEMQEQLDMLKYGYPIE